MAGFKWLGGNWDKTAWWYISCISDSSESAVVPCASGSSRGCAADKALGTGTAVLPEAEPLPHHPLLTFTIYPLSEKHGIFAVQDNRRRLSVCPCSVRLHPRKPWGRYEENVFPALCSNRQGTLIRACALKTLPYPCQCYWDRLVKRWLEGDPTANASGSERCLELFPSSALNLSTSKY